MRGRRDGFSLLEVLLAMGILLGSIVVLGELARLGRRNAEAARDLTRAQLLCQSKLNEITSGALRPDPVTGAPLEEAPGWLFSVELEPAPDEPLELLAVTVSQDLPERKQPARFRLVRWIAPAHRGGTSRSTQNELVTRRDAVGAETVRP